MSENAAAPPAPAKPSHRWERIALISVAIVLLLAGIAIRRVVQTLRAVSSGSNLREISGYLYIYQADHAGHYPDKLGDLALEGNSEFSAERFVIPGGKATVATGTPQQIADQLNSDKHCSYIYIGKGLTADVADSSTIVIYESDRDRPLDSILCLCGDGHGESDTASEILQFTVAPMNQKLAALAARVPESQKHARTRHSATTTQTAP